jgi:hypothetical protein
MKNSSTVKQKQTASNRVVVNINQEKTKKPKKKATKKKATINTSKIQQWRVVNQSYPPPFHVIPNFQIERELHEIKTNLNQMKIVNHQPSIENPNPTGDTNTKRLNKWIKDQTKVIPLPRNPLPSISSSTYHSFSIPSETEKTSVASGRATHHLDFLSNSSGK